MLVTRVSNAGVLISAAEHTVLIDALHTGSLWPYLPPQSSVTELDADLVAFTHAHPDHFDAAAAAAYLLSHPSARVLCTAQAKGALVSHGIGNERFLKDEFRTDGFSLEAFPTRHLGKDWRKCEHISFMLCGSVLFTGDAVPAYSNFSGRRSSAVIAPYPYALTGIGLRILRDTLGAKTLVVVHLPPMDADNDGLNARLSILTQECSAVRIYAPAIGESICL